MNVVKIPNCSSWAPGATGAAWEVGGGGGVAKRGREGGDPTAVGRNTH